ncbi:hypothetical protein BH10BDE1_BH10BDE1_23140 [soil metagenome]
MKNLIRTFVLLAATAISTTALASGQTGYPAPEKWNSICNDPSAERYRSLTIVNATMLPNLSFDFSRRDSLTAISVVSVYINKDHSAQIQCFWEGVRITAMKMIDGRLGEIEVTTDENIRSKGPRLDPTLNAMIGASPTGWSTSGYYAEILKRLSGSDFASTLAISNIEPNTYFKVVSRVIPAANPSAHVSLTIINAAGNGVPNLDGTEPAYLAFETAQGAQGPELYMSYFTNLGLSMNTKTWINGDAPVCEMIPQAQLDSELAKGPTQTDIYNRHYGPTCKPAAKAK